MPTTDITYIPLLTFMLDGRRYAIRVAEVVEVSAMVALDGLAAAREGLLGLANRHGAPLPVYDLRTLMGLQASAISVDSLFIVCEVDDTLFGLLVDEIQQVIYVPQAAISKIAGAAPAFTQVASYENALIQMISTAPLLTPFVIPDQARKSSSSEDVHAGASA